MSYYEYCLVDDKNNEFPLLSDRLHIDLDDLNIESNVLERSFGDGGLDTGKKRRTTKDYSLNFEVLHKNNVDFRLYINTLEYNFYKAKYLRNSTLSIDLPVLAKKLTVNYEKGSEFHYAYVELNFVALTPYWQDENFTEIIVNNVTAGTVQINTSLSFISLPLIFEITALNPGDSIRIRDNTKGNGIAVKDELIGLNDLNFVVIDNENGKILLNTIDRSNKLEANSGFFNIAEQSLIELEYQFSFNADFKIKYKNRVYL